MKWPGIRLFSMILLLFAVLYACQKTDSGGTGRGHQAEFVRASLSGRVTDENNMPVTGANVTAGSTTIATDADGYFTVSNVYIDKNAAVIKVEKTGYFTGTKTIIAEVEKNNPVIIELIPKTVAGIINGANGGEVTVPASGGSILLEPNGVIDAQSNKAYTGAVTVSAYFIDPSAENFRQIMPGTLRGISANDEETGLQSFGMMAVELNGAGGEKLQIASGKKATLHFPIAEALRDQAPATIPLWSLDEYTGLWKEEGQATRQGNEYTGEVSHFSYWNCDVPFPIVNFTVTIQDQQGQPISGGEVVISSNATDAISISASGHTNAEGIVKGTLPANRSLLLKVFDKCRNLLAAKNIGPFSTETDLGTITANIQTSQVTVSGSVINCNSAPLANGYVLMELENMYYSIPVTNGNFSQTIARCGTAQTTATFKAYDIAGNSAGAAVGLTVTGNTLQTGQLTTCGTALNAYINYTVDGTSFFIDPAGDSIVALMINSNVTAIGAFPKNDTTKTHLLFQMSGERHAGVNNNVSVLYIYKGDVEYIRDGTITAAITEYGAGVGEYISGAFSGTAIDSARNRTVPVQCNFRVRITEKR
jgi:Carboxypeptidase regulatory-like domain